MHARIVLPRRRDRSEPSLADRPRPAPAAILLVTRLLGSDALADSAEETRLNEDMAEAIDVLPEIDPRKAAVVRLRFPSELRTVQIAEAMRVARSTIDAQRGSVG